MLYEKIVAVATERGTSIRKIEEECGLSNGSVIKWRTSKPAAESLYKVAKFLGLTVEDLLKED